MSEDARYLTDQAMFWLEQARRGSAQAGSASYWERRCRELAAGLIGAGL